MAATSIIVNCYFTDPVLTGGPPPLVPDSRKTTTSGGTVVLPALTRWVIISCDADCRFTADGSAVVAGDRPVLSAVDNPYQVNGASGLITLAFT